MFRISQTQLIFWIIFVLNWVYLSHYCVFSASSIYLSSCWSIYQNKHSLFCYTHSTYTYNVLLALPFFLPSQSTCISSTSTQQPNQSPGWTWIKASHSLTEPLPHKCFLMCRMSLMADRNRFRNNPVYVDYHLFICILVEQEYMGRRTSQSWDRAFRRK